ncbi:unnamed protein product [Lampetra planeri]
MTRQPRDRQPWLRRERCCRPGSWLPRHPPSHRHHAAHCGRRIAASRSCSMPLPPSSVTSTARRQQRGRRYAASDAVPNKSEATRLPGGRSSPVHQRLPALKGFSTAGGDWAAFQHRFMSHREMVGWLEAEALRALPAALDDNALAALITIPQADRSTLQQALGQMQVIYGPQSDSRHRFNNRRKGESETLLAFRSTLLALARATFPRMDHEAIDAMVLEKLLSLVWELLIDMPAVDDDEFCSLRTARCIQEHLLLQRDTSLAACTTPADTSSSEEEPTHDQAFAATQGTVLAHVAPALLGNSVVSHVGDVPTSKLRSDLDERWIDSLCSASANLTDSQQDAAGVTSPRRATLAAPDGEHSSAKLRSNQDAQVPTDPQL